MLRKGHKNMKKFYQKYYDCFCIGDFKTRDSALHAIFDVSFLARLVSRFSENRKIKHLEKIRKVKNSAKRQIAITKKT